MRYNTTQHSYTREEYISLKELLLQRIISTKKPTVHFCTVGFLYLRRIEAEGKENSRKIHLAKSII